MLEIPNGMNINFSNNPCPFYMVSHIEYIKTRKHFSKVFLNSFTPTLNAGPISDVLYLIFACKCARYSVGHMAVLLIF